MPILSIDFLPACNFNINVHNASITDKCTNSSIQASTTSMKNVTHITSIIPRSDYLQLLNEFPALLSENPFTHPRIMWYIAFALQEGPSTAGLDASALIFLTQSNLILPSYSPMVLSRSAARLGVALCIVYPKEMTRGAPQATTGSSITSPLLTYPLSHLQSFTDQLHG